MDICGESQRHPVAGAGRCQAHSFQGGKGMRKMASVLALIMVALVFGVAATAQDRLQRGKEVYDYWCINCHGSFPGTPGTQALEVLYGGLKPADLEERTDLPAELVRLYVRTGVSIMPTFRKTEISDEDLEALVAYLAFDYEL